MKQEVSARPVEPPDPETVTVRIPRQTARRMKEIAAAQERSLAGELRWMINDRIEREDREQVAA